MNTGNKITQFKSPNIMQGAVIFIWVWKTQSRQRTQIDIKETQELPSIINEAIS